MRSYKYNRVHAGSLHAAQVEGSIADDRTLIWAVIVANQF